MFEFRRSHWHSWAVVVAVALGQGCLAADSEGVGAEATAASTQESLTGLTMTLSSRLYPSGAPVPGTTAVTAIVEPGSTISLDTPALVEVPNPGHDPDRYNFLFWHVPRLLATSPSMTITAPTSGSSFRVTAWYQIVVCPTCPGGEPQVTTVTISDEQDAVIGDTPIASVNPSEEWTGPPATVVATTAATPTVITARPLIDGAGEFVSWLSFRNAPISGRTLTEASRTSDLALALFAFPSPDPCADLRLARDNLDPGDFPTLDAYHKALAKAIAMVRTCEKAHGEPPG